MGVDIDKLNIEVSTNAGNVAKEIDKISKTMEKLKQSVKNTGLPRLCNQLKKLKETAQELSGLNAYTEKVAKFSESIHKLSGLKIPSVSKMTARVKELVDMSKEMSSFTGADELAEKVNQICSAMKPMESMGKNTLAPFINSMKKIPELTKSMDTKAMQDLKNMIKEITSAIQPLITQVSKSEKGLVSLNRIIQSTVSSNGNLAASNAAAVKSYTSVSSILTSTKAKLLAYSYAVIRVTRVLKDWLDLSNDYIENLNLFEVAMGKGAKEALNYAESINKALGLDVSDWIRNQGVFKQVTSGFGVLNDTSDTMSKNLTQLGYDISSFFNIDVDEAMQKLQSGISGEIEPLRRLGYAIDATTLQQVAYSKGITLNINKMTQAQKSQLRYIAILQQSQNVMGDMARTVTTPANAMRILDQQFTQLKRSIGNIISILVQKLLPYIQAFVRLLGDAADYLAKLWGFELPTIDYSNVGNGLSTISDEADNATESVKQTAKQMRMLAGFDELNILGDSKSNSDDFSVSSANPDLGIQMPEYDFLSGLDNQSDSVYKNMKEKALELIRKFKSLADWIKENKMLVGILAGAFATLYAAKKIKDFFKKLDGLSILKTAKTWLKNFIDGFKSEKGVSFFKKLKNGVKGFRDGLTKTQKILGTVVGVVMSSHGSYDLFKNLAKDTADWKTVLGDSALIVGGLGMSWIFGGLPGLAIGGLITAFAGLYGYIKGCDEKLVEIETKNVESLLFNNGGIKICELTEAFRNQFDGLTELSSILSDYDQQIEDNRASIDEYQGTIDTYKEKIKGTGKLSEEEITPMQEAVSGLVDALQEGINLECSKFFEIVKNSVSNVAEDVGLDIQSMTTALTEFQNTFSTETDKLNSDVNSYLDKLKLGEPVTPEEKKAYEDALTTLSELSKSVTEEEVNFKEKLNSFLTVDYESETDFTSAFNDLKNAADEAKGAAEDIYISSKTNYENLKLQVKSSYEAGLIGEDMYKTTTQELENYKKGIEEAYKDKKEEISSSLQDIIQKMYDNVDEVVRTRLDANSSVSSKNVEKYYDDMKKSLSWVYDELDKFIEKKGLEIDKTASEQWLRNKKGYFTAKDLLDQDEWKKEAIKCGYQVVDGFDVGLTDNQIKALKSVKNNNELTMAEWKRFWDINSPSKETEKIGKYLVEGESQGIEKNTHLVITSIRSLSEEMLKTARENFDFYSIGQKCIDTLTEGISQNMKKLSGVLYSIGIDGASISLNGLNSSNMSTSIHGYASGGFPTSGQLFYARENGMPEMVGKIGNQTAVANNNQIEKGIENAVYKAMTSANGSGFSSNNQPVNITVPVYIDGQKMDEQQYNYRQRQLVRSNGRREY